MGRRMDQLELSDTAGPSAKWYSHFEASSVVSYKVKHTLGIGLRILTFRYLFKIVHIKTCPQMA